jgi:hypothetical protein
LKSNTDNYRLLIFLPLKCFLAQRKFALDFSHYQNEWFLGRREEESKENMKEII